MGKDCGSVSLYAYSSGSPGTPCETNGGVGVVRGSRLLGLRETPPVVGPSTTGVVNCARRAGLCATDSIACYVGLDGRVDCRCIIAGTVRW